MCQQVVIGDCPIITMHCVTMRDACEVCRNWPVEGNLEPDNDPSTDIHRSNILYNSLSGESFTEKDVGELLSESRNSTTVGYNSSPAL